MLNLQQLERLVEQTHRSMDSNWTTMGLKNNMRQLFLEMRDNMQQVVDESEKARKLLRSIYRRFQNQHGFSVVHPKMFSIMRYRVELELLYQEAEAFRNNPMTAMTEKHFLIRRFFMVIVSRARMIFTTARNEVDDWLNTALEPLALQIDEYRDRMEMRLQDLQKVSHSRETLDHRVMELRKQEKAITRQQVILRNMYGTLNDSRPLAEGERPRPQLVHNSSASN